MTPSPRVAHPALFMVLILPFGAMSGYLTVTVAYTLSQAGLSVEQVAELVAVSFIPHTWKFLWAPIADTTLARKTWYLLASVVSGVGIYATGAIPASAGNMMPLYTVVLVSNVAVTFLAMAVESLMVYNTPFEQKGRASGWFQAGNLGGGGLGGGAGLWMAQVLPAPWMSGAVLGLACVLCCFALLRVPEPVALARSSHYGRDLQYVIRDMWEVVRSRPGFLALLICFLPMCTGAAGGLWSAVADDWHASADTVALVTGVLGGIVSAVGCLAGGYLCDRMDRKQSYLLYGLLQVVCAVAMALAPRTEAMYVVFTTVYALISGFTYAGFSAVVLEAMGKGAAATKYNVFASLSNMPIAYMIVLEGWAQTRWGAGGMLYTESVLAVAAILLFVAANAVRPHRSRTMRG